MLEPLWNNFITGILLRLAFIYCAACFLLWLIQDYLIYVPFRDNRAVTEAKAEALGLDLWPDRLQPGSYRAFYFDPYHSRNQARLAAEGFALPPEPRGTIIICHGNAASAVRRGYYLLPLASRGFRVVVCEYPGYGARDGKPRESTLVDDVAETIRAVEAAGIGPIYLWGESIGSGVVGSVLRDTSLPVDGAVLFTPFASLADAAQQRFWFMPTAWLVADKYNTIENIQAFAGKPIAVVIAENDSIIPPAQAERLYSAVPSPKLCYVMPDAEHNQWDFYPTSEWWDKVLDFITQQAPRNEARMADELGQSKTNKDEPKTLLP